MEKTKEETKMLFELKTWDDVDTCLREIAELEIISANIEGDMNLTINEAKEKAVKLSAPVKARMEAMQKLIKSFTENNKDSIEGKTKNLTYGKVGFRASSSVSVSTKKMADIILNLKKYGMTDCLSIKETVNKEVLEKYSDKDIAKVGASKKYEDKFWMETDKTKLKK